MGGLRPTAEPAPSRVRGLAELVGARVFVDVTIPRTQVTGKMRLISRAETALVNADARDALKLPLDSKSLLGPGVMEDWLAEVAVRTLAIAVRDPDEIDKPLDDVDTWRELVDDDQIAALWEQYKALAAKHDPLGETGAMLLSEDEITQLTNALKKKDVDLLIGFGSRKLASFMLTSVAPPSS